MKRFIAFCLGSLSAVVLLFVLHTHIPYVSSFIKKIELKTLDYRMKFAKQPATSPAIKIVVVHDASNLSDKLAQFIRLVTSEQNAQFKPKVIGFNYRFDATVNEELVAMASLANNIFYGYSFEFAPQHTEAEATNRDIMPFRLEITDIGDSASKVFEAQRVQLPSHRYLTTARGIGFVNTLADSDGVFRRVPLFLKYQDNWYGSLALLIAMEYLDIESVDITFYPGQYVEITQDDGNFMKIPVNEYGEMLIDFAAPSAEGELAPFETIAMEDLLRHVEEHPQGAPSALLASLKDAVVLVGSEGEHPIPLSPSYPLIGIHANFISNIATNTFIKELPKVFVIGILVFLGMFTGLVLGSHRFVVKCLLALFFSILYLLLAYGMYFQFRLLLPVVPALFTIGLTLCSVGIAVRHKASASSGKSRARGPREKKRKTNAPAEDVSALEDSLLEIREELDRKSLRLRSKVEELRVLQESSETNHYDYTRQVASLQKEIRAREIEIKSLIAKEEELRRQVENLPYQTPDTSQIRGNTEKLARVFAQHGFITGNEYILHSLTRLENLSRASVAILIQGEAGTGKKFLAQIARELSSRHNRPVLEVLCAGDMDLLEDDLFGHRKGAFPGADDHRLGFFRKIDGGTLILESIENLSMEVQTRLVHTLRGKAVRPLGEDLGYPVDVRVLATTSQNLQELVAQGKFREDLYHYFSIFPLYLPSLRDRKEDIPALVNYFVKKYNHVHSKIVETLSDEALHTLIRYQWPGNITELEKVVERALVEVPPGEKELSEQYLTFENADFTSGINDPGMLNYLIALMDSTRELPAYQPLREKVLAEIQRLYCARLLRLHNGHVKNASIDAGLKHETFKKMLRELMIDPEHYQY